MYLNVVNECNRRMILNLSPDFPRDMGKTAPRNSGGQAHFTLQKQGPCAIADSCADLLCQSHLHFWQAGGLANWLWVGKCGQFDSVNRAGAGPGVARMTDSISTREHHAIGLDQV